MNGHPGKAAINKKKHSVSFKEASTIFGDPDSITFDDPDHSAQEHRLITVGKSKAGRVLIVAHTERSNAIRIISARKTTKSEKNSYEDEK